jgi:prevent-host-death family protein
MAKVTSTEANRSFSKLLAKVKKGEETEITVRGEVVAKLVPSTARAKKFTVKERRDWEEFMERLRSQPTLNLPKFNRDELYD